MNCQQVRDQLPGLLYGEVSPADKAELEKHLAQCPSCAKEHRALQGVRQLLGVAIVPEVRLDLASLYQRAAEQQARRLRRWRRLAVVATGMAAAIAVVALGLRLEARVEPHQLVLRWGVPPAPSPEPLPSAPKEPPPAAEPPRMVHLSEDQIQLLGRLVHALADDLQVLERQRREDTAQVRSQLRALQQENLQRCAAIERNVDALYVLSHKGE
jgi:hypothetical protein